MVGNSVIPKQWQRYFYQTRLKLKQLLAKNDDSLCLTIIIFSLGLLLLMLLSPQLFSEQLITNNTSTRTVFAEKTILVEDKAQTERLRLDTEAAVEPVYREMPGASRLVMDKTLHLLENISELAENNIVNISRKQYLLSGLLDKTPKVVSARFAPYVSSATEWMPIYEATVDCLENLLKQGVNSEDSRSHRDELIQRYLPSDWDVNELRSQMVVAIVAQKLRPTLSIDEELTKEAQKAAVYKLSPVMHTFTKGDIIIQRGEHPTPLQLEALKKQGLLINDNRTLHFFGLILLAVSIIPGIWGYLYQFERKTFFKPSYVSLLATLLIMGIGGMVIWQNAFPTAVHLYPMAIFSFLMTIFMNARVALSITMLVLILCGLGLQISLDTIAILALSSLAGITVLVRRPIPKDRFDILNAGAGVGLVHAFSLIMINLIYQPLSMTDPLNALIQAILAIGSGLLSGMITLGALPMFEQWFKLITPFTLLELSKLDSAILKRMQLEAPGTFHHSLIISTISEAAAEAIGANGLLARVGSLYHDIGKMRRPLFFIENQAYFGSENPHDKLSPRLSKMIVMAHPRDGMDMGRKLGLPEQIIDFMPMHHGTLLVGYFYNKAVLEEGEENVDPAQYRYPGPKPNTKETAIVMLADACESSVRALKNPTQEQLEARIDKMFKQRIDDQQFSEAPITMKEIQTVRDTFVRVLKAMHHNRIEYQQAVIKDFSRHAVVNPPSITEIEPQQLKPL